MAVSRETIKIKLYKTHISNTYIYIYTAPDRIMGKKNVSIYRCRLSMIEKLNLFFFHNYCFHIFFHNSVGDSMSIDSQFERILRGEY